MSKPRPPDKFPHPVNLYSCYHVDERAATKEVVRVPLYAANLRSLGREAGYDLSLWRDFELVALHMYSNNDDSVWLDILDGLLPKSEQTRGRDTPE